MQTVSFEGWDRAEAVLALWKGARTVRPGSMPTIEQINAYIAQPETRIDYVGGRSLKLGDINESWPILYSELYDRDNGIGTMQRVATNRSDRDVII